MTPVSLTGYSAVSCCSSSGQLAACVHFLLQLLITGSHCAILTSGFFFFSICLQQVGGLNLAHTRLQSIAALSKLTVLQGDLVAWDNPALASLQGLGGVTQMYGKLWLDENPLLQDLNGLQVSDASPAHHQSEGLYDYNVHGQQQALIVLTCCSMRVAPSFVMEFCS
jgi:hypothetical protein